MSEHFFPPDTALQPPPAHNQPEYSVSEISTALKRVVEDNFGYVRVRGELSGVKIAASGHAYFSLKDDKAVLSGVCWRGNVSRLQCRPEDGLEVICTGKISTYPGRSNYQIIVTHMEPAGAGALMALLEKRKHALAAEGLFDENRKQPLPFLPTVIGVVTSPTGAVIRDILHRIKDRFARHVVVWPVAVQGEGAAEQIAEAITGFNALPAALPRPDLLIVARGGGSLEDLWAFNEEVVVRAAAASTIPIISAVGHETDTTLIDYAADKRAPTPTGAAEMAVPVLSDCLYTISQKHDRLQVALRRTLEGRSERLRGLSRGLPRPAQLLELVTQKLDDWSERLRHGLPHLVERKKHVLRAAATGLRPHNLRRDYTRYLERLTENSHRLQQACIRTVTEQHGRLGSATQLLESLNYTQVLKRGFALVRDGKGTVISTAGAAGAAGDLSVTFHDGKVEAQVKRPSKQGELF